MTEEPLTEQEEKWIARLAKVMSSGYGADRGRTPTHVRSGVYRGALLALLPLVDRYIEDFDSTHPLVDLGYTQMRESLSTSRFLPLPRD